MTLSRALPLFLIAAGAGPAEADPITAEAAFKHYREQFQTLRELDCPRGDEIIVCGRSTGNGLRIPYGPTPGEPVHLVAGEPPSGRNNLGISECVRSCPQPLQVDLIGAARTAGKVIGHILGKDD
jgi:hypothetical protein